MVAAMRTCPDCGNTFTPLGIGEVGLHGPTYHWHPGLDAFSTTEQCTFPRAGNWSVVGVSSAAVALADPVAPRSPNRADRRRVKRAG